MNTGSNEYVGIRYTGKICPKVSGAHTFYLMGDNGFKLWVNGVLLIDFWQNQWDIPKTSPTIDLVAGQKYDFKLEYFQATGGANLHFSWSAPGLAKETVPDSAFFLGSNYTGPYISNIDTSNAVLIQGAAAL